MPLQRGEVLGYDFNRMVVDFTMFNQGKTVRCAISTAAMDDLEGKHDVRADQRIDQFVRLRDAIEERASRKFFEGPVEAKGPVVLRSNVSSSSHLVPRCCHLVRSASVTGIRRCCRTLPGRARTGHNSWHPSLGCLRGRRDAGYPQRLLEGQ
jgi:hypothetical protein